jgi:hypothetical protein
MVDVRLARSFARRAYSVAALPPRQTSAAAWRGSDLATDSSRWTWALSSDEIDAISNAADAAIAVEGWQSRLVSAPASESFPLPPSLEERLRILRRELTHGRGFELVRGLPLHEWSKLKAAAAFVGIGRHIGGLRSQNKEGHLLGSVADTGADATDPHTRIYQTAVRQTFHADSCDVVALACLQTARTGGESLLCSALAVWNVLLSTGRRDLAAALLAPVAIDRRGEVPLGMEPYFMMPPLAWDQSSGLLGVGAGYQRQYIDSAVRLPGAPRLSAVQVEALDAFDALLDDPALRLAMRLEQGDVQFVYNHALLHDRTAFTDDAAPAKRRQLYRLWISPPEDRRLPGAFAQRFGSTTIGDRGGIDCPGVVPTLGVL